MPKAEGNEPSEEELERIRGRGIFKPNLQRTISSLKAARTDLVSEVASDTLTEEEVVRVNRELKAVDVVIEELERWSKSKSNWMSGKRVQRIRQF